MNVENIFEELKEHLRKILVNLSFILPFWALAIFITKPSFLNNPIHIQFILTFCLSSMWLLIYFLITVAFITIFKKENIFIALEIGNLLGIFSLCTFINISYYFSESLTTLLQKSFTFSLVLLSTLLILNFLNFARKYKREQ